MQPPSSLMTIVPCHGCSRDLPVPKTHVRAAIRDERPYVVFCSRACNLKHVAREGARQQEEGLLYAN